MIKKILIPLTLTLIFTGCENNHESQKAHDAKVAAAAKAELRVELQKEAAEKARLQEEALQKDNKLAHMGITTTDGKLIIDTNKTKSYFEKMAGNLQKHADKFAKDLQKGVIDDKDAGIVVSDTKINIDLNKTKSFLDNWGATLESYAKEFQKMTQDMNTSN